MRENRLVYLIFAGIFTLVFNICVHTYASYTLEPFIVSRIVPGSDFSNNVLESTKFSFTPDEFVKGCHAYSKNVKDSFVEANNTYYNKELIVRGMVKSKCFWTKDGVKGVSGTEAFDTCTLSYIQKYHEVIAIGLNLDNGLSAEKIREAMYKKEKVPIVSDFVIVINDRQMWDGIRTGDFVKVRCKFNQAKIITNEGIAPMYLQGFMFDNGVVVNKI